MTYKHTDQWVATLASCGVGIPTAARWAPFFSQCVVPEAFSRGEEEIDDFVVQILHESNRLKSLEENLNYTTPERLCKIWPRRFPTLKDAYPYLRNPQALAAKVYGGRLGNATDADAYKYRGGGLIMVTGYTNYLAVTKATGLPLIDKPELIRVPGAEALKVCISWWEGNVPDSAMGDIKKVTRAVNGGQIGLSDRMALMDKYQSASEARA